MTESSSRDAHAESNAHHASVCKACALSSAAGTAGSCQAAERLARVELGLKRLHLAVWITLVVLIIVLAFVAGQRTQSKNAMMQGRPNENGNIGRRNPLGPNGMPGSMRGMNGNPNGTGNPNGNPNGNQTATLKFALNAMKMTTTTAQMMTKKTAIAIMASQRNA